MPSQYRRLCDFFEVCPVGVHDAERCRAPEASMEHSTFTRYFKESHPPPIGGPGGVQLPLRCFSDPEEILAIHVDRIDIPLAIVVHGEG